MVIKIQYENQVDRQNIINSNKDKILIEEQNIRDGNFLIFVDEEPVEKKISNLQNDNLIVFEVLATIYEELQAQKGSV